MDPVPGSQARTPRRKLTSGWERRSPERCAKKWEQAGQDSAHLNLGNNHSVRCRGKRVGGGEQTHRANQRLQQELGSWILLS